MIQKAADLRDVRTDELVVNMGPQHPATHGVLRVVVKTDGEVVLDVQPHIGNLHRCKERIGENLLYGQFMPYTDRMDYLAAMNNEFCYALAVEKLLGVAPPERTNYIRVCMAELNRIASHLMSIGTYGLDMGAITPFLYAFRERETALDLMEEVSGGRMLYHYIRIGGIARDLPEGWTGRCRALMDDMDRRIVQYNTLLTWNKIFIERTAGIGVLDRATALDWGFTGPGLRAAGVDWDVRRDEPYSVYPELKFKVPFGHGDAKGETVGVLGDCWHRHWIRMLEMEQSVSLVRQCLSKIDSLPKPENADAISAKVPKLLRPAEGEVYFRAENPRGELAFYLQSDGSTNPWRLRIRGPSFVNIALLGAISKGHLLADLVAIIGSIDIVLGEVDPVSLLASSGVLDVIQAVWSITVVRGLLWSVGIVLLVITPMALMAIWIERRLSGLMQARIGPNRVGPEGLLQTLADGVKLLGKESLVPTEADKPLFHLAPIVVFVAAFGMYAALPWGPDWTPTNIAVGILVVLGVGSIEAVGVIMAGWASNNKWALLGTMRVAAQVVSYEVPLALCALVPVLSAGTLNVQEITRMQQGALWNWGVFWAFPANVLACIVFFWSALANLKRAPFDLPEAESELVAGFHTEYSGMSFSIFFLAEYAAMFVLSGVAAALWFGGWGLPWLPVEEWARAGGGIFGIEWLPRVAVWNFVAFNILAFKAMLLVCVMMWLRWTLPRVRIDQVMRLCWKFFLPISLGCLVWAAAWVAVFAPMLGGEAVMGYFADIKSGVSTTLQGMKITWATMFEPTFTIEYPDVQKEIPDSERGIHEYDVERCIACDNCAKACPVSCIYIESEGKGKAAKLTRFEIDYQKCLFCNLCVPPCPVDCIKMGKEFDLSGYDREDMIVPFHLGIRPIKERTQVALDDIAKRKADAEKAAAPKPPAPPAPPTA